MVPSVYRGMTAAALHLLLTCAAPEDLRQNGDIALAVLAECAAAQLVQQNHVQYAADARTSIAEESDEAAYTSALAAMRDLGIDFQQASKCALAALHGPCLQIPALVYQSSLHAGHVLSVASLADRAACLLPCPAGQVAAAL